MAAPTRKILIAMDGSKHSNYAFDWFMKYFYKDKDDVVIVYCSEHGQGPVNTGNTQSNDPSTIARLTKEEDGDVSNLLAVLQKKLTTAGIKGSVVRVGGHKPGEAIVRASDEHKVDMVITGTRGHSSIRRTLMGSCSQYIVHHAQVPVLVVRYE